MPRKLTIKDFIKKAIKIHDNKYIYSKFRYVNSKTNGIIICKKHGVFEQTPSNHLKGHKCPKCAKENIVKKQRMTIEEFVIRARRVHDIAKYDYSEVNYEGALIKVKIICKFHGEFWQTPSHHLNGKRGCPKCAIENKAKKIRPTKEEFVEKAKKIHKNKYNYLEFKYINAITKGIIICPVHKRFEQTPNSHLNGKHGCPKCGGSERKTTEGFIKQAKIVHGNNYIYVKFKYINAIIKGIIICKKHGEFLQTPDSHLRGSGCPKCYGRISKAEKKWLDEMERKENIKIERQKVVYYYKDNKKKYFKVDGFDASINTCFEYNGNYWHGNPKIYNKNDKHPIVNKTFGELYQETLKKEKLIKKSGFNLITKWGD